jgi:hypothetical protein
MKRTVASLFERLAAPLLDWLIGDQSPLRCVFCRDLRSKGGVCSGCLDTLWRMDGGRS